MNKFIDALKEKQEKSGELFDKLYHLKNQYKEISESIKETTDKILKLNPMEGKSKVMNHEGKKFNFKQNFKTDKITDKNRAFELFDLDTLISCFTVDLKPKKIKEEFPYVVKEFYKDYIEEGLPSSISCKIDELPDDE